MNPKAKVYESLADISEGKTALEHYRQALNELNPHKHEDKGDIKRIGDKIREIEKTP